MSRSLNRASAIALAATLITLFSASGTGAAAQNVANRPSAPAIDEPTPLLPSVSKAVVQPLPATASDDEDAVIDTDSDAAPIRASSLSALVDAQPQPDDLSRELNCLAGAIYFEAKSESLPGQLAVGRVIVARSKSGRFPSSYCGVVFQRSQFSFVRGGGMPAINHASRQWKNAAAIAQIANEGSWKSPAEGALYFHAAYVSPGWHLTRIARIENHVFYR